MYERPIKDLGLRGEVVASLSMIRYNSLCSNWTKMKFTSETRTNQCGKNRLFSIIFSPVLQKSDVFEVRCLYHQWLYLIVLLENEKKWKNRIWRKLSLSIWTKSEFLLAGSFFSNEQRRFVCCCKFFLFAASLLHACSISQSIKKNSTVFLLHP